MKNFKKILQWIIAVELLVAGFLVMSLFVPLPGDVEVKIVQSGSMEPSVPVGSIVTVVPKGSYSVGDIITFGKDNKKTIPTTHRIIGIEREEGSIRYVTKGDANEEKDNALVRHSEIIGSVAFTVPRVGYVIDFARTKNGFMFMVVIPALLIMLDEIINIFSVVKSTNSRQTTPAQERRKAIEKVAIGLPPQYSFKSPHTDGYSVVLRSMHT